MENAIKHHKFDTLYLWDLCMDLILLSICYPAKQCRMLFEPVYLYRVHTIAAAHCPKCYSGVARNNRR